MKKSRFTEAQIVGMLREHEAGKKAFLLKCGQLPAHYTGSRADFPTVQQDIHNTTTLRSTFTNHCA
jgi:hypothetical protein